MEIITQDKIKDEFLSSLVYKFYNNIIFIIALRDVHYPSGDKCQKIFKLSMCHNRRLIWSELLGNSYNGKEYEFIEDAIYDFLNYSNGGSSVTDIKIYKFNNQSEFIAWLSRYALWK